MNMLIQTKIPTVQQQDNSKRNLKLERIEVLFLRRQKLTEFAQKIEGTEMIFATTIKFYIGRVIKDGVL